MCQLPGSTSTYCAVLDGTGELIHGIGDMSANEEITPSWVRTMCHARYVTVTRSLGQDVPGYASLRPFSVYRW